MDLDSMKYAELRCLAKELGIKAYNKTKADKLLMVIKRHYQQEETVQENETNVDSQVDINESQPLVQDEPVTDEPVTDEPVLTPVSFVTKRGKGKKSKRNICETELPYATSKENEVAEAGAGSAKRKRYSSMGASGAIVPPEISDIGVTGNEQKPHHADEVSVGGGATDNGRKTKTGGKIPRHEGLLNKSKALKQATPNFKKLHEAHFKKMESIDSYVQRKQKQMETYSNSVKDLKKPPPCRASLFSPALSKPADDKRRQTSASKPVLKKPPQNDDALFRPSVLSTRRINVRFSQATQDNEHKRSLVKTPSRMSTGISLGTPGKWNNDGGKVNPAKAASVSAIKTPGTFVFMGNVSVSNTPGNNKKPSFDLKESLARPLSYKPHKGKLKPFGENATGNDTQISHSHQKKYKQHQVQTREDRRVKHVNDRKQKKENILGARRGLVMS